MTGQVDRSKPNDQEATAALTALYEATIRSLRSTNKRKLAAVTRAFEGRLAAAYEQLNVSAEEVSRAQSKVDALQRSVRHLKDDNTARLVSERRAIKDMQQLAARVLELHSDANRRLDRTSAAIFARRGWNTKMAKS